MFPGSNCAADTVYALNLLENMEANLLWHKERKIKGLDLIVLPGGFSYGDYLRSGAIARFSPIMEEIKEWAANGGLVLGICNGFQLLTEANLLPGSFLRNRSLKFVCRLQTLRVENNFTPFTGLYKKGEIIKLPIAHNDGNYIVDPLTLEQMEESKQVIFRYCQEDGEVTNKSNPNGSINKYCWHLLQRGKCSGDDAPSRKGHGGNFRL